MPSVLITGCSSGFGLALARHFAERGWLVFASMRRPSAGEPLLKEAAERGWNLQVPRIDVTDDQQVREAVSKILSDAGNRLDVLINNAGYFCIGAVEDTSPDELRSQLETNLLGALRMCRVVLPAFRARGQGRIVNISSLAALSVIPALGPYHASKAALESLTEALRYEVSPFGIKVSSVLPGPFPTNLVANQVKVAETDREEGPYASLVAHLESLNRKAPRGKVEQVVNAVYKASTARRPRARYAVGPFSLLATYGRPVTPAWLYTLLVRWVFRLQSLAPKK